MNRLAGYFLNTADAREFAKILGAKEEGIKDNLLEWSFNTWIFRNKNVNTNIRKAAFVPKHEDVPEDGYMFITRARAFHPQAPIPQMNEGDYDRVAKRWMEVNMVGTALEEVDLRWMTCTDGFGIALDGLRARDAEVPNVTITSISLADWLKEKEAIIAKRDREAQEE